METWLKDAVYVWEVGIDRTRMRVLSAEDDTRRCIAHYGVGEGMNATLDWEAMERDGYSGMEVREYHQDIRYEQGWYYEIDIESGVLWDETAVHGAWPIAIRRPDGRYYTKIRSMRAGGRTADVRLSDAEAAAALRGEEETEPASGSTTARRTPRRCTVIQSYSQTAARAPRRPRELPPYLERGAVRCRRGAKRDAVEVGALTVERTVHGGYEWRDAQYAPVRGARRRIWDTWHE